MDGAHPASQHQQVGNRIVFIRRMGLQRTSKSMIKGIQGAFCGLPKPFPSLSRRAETISEAIVHGIVPVYIHGTYTPQASSSLKFSLFAWRRSQSAGNSRPGSKQTAGPRGRDVETSSGGQLLRQTPAAACPRVQLPQGEGRPIAQHVLLDRALQGAGGASTVFWAQTARGN